MLNTKGNNSIDLCRGSKMASHAEQMQKHFQTNGRTRDIQIHTAKVHSVAWSADGRRLASGSFDKTVAIYIVERERLVSWASFLGFQFVVANIN